MKTHKPPHIELCYPVHHWHNGTCMKCCGCVVGEKMISFTWEIIQVQCREWWKGHWVNALGPSRGRDDDSLWSNAHKLKWREVMDWRWVVTSRTRSKLLAYAVVRKDPTDSDRAYGRALGGRLWVWLWVYWVLAAFEISKWNVQWSVKYM